MLPDEHPSRRGRSNALSRASDLARLLAAPNGRRYRIEACEGHRPPPIEGSGPAA
jgi:hypothetical protein